MKKQLFFIILLGVVELLAGCRPEGKEPETGVSIGLARQRKQDISNLQYRLKFRIPENKQEEVIGKVQITLKQEKVQPVVLDFREDPHKVKQLKVNGRPDSIRISNEHIVVGTDYLKKGANEIEIDFIAGNQSLNRNDEFLYTLWVPTNVPTWNKRRRSVSKKRSTHAVRRNSNTAEPEQPPLCLSVISISLPGSSTALFGMLLAGCPRT